MATVFLNDARYSLGREEKRRERGREIGREEGEREEEREGGRGGDPIQFCLLLVTDLRLQLPFHLGVFLFRHTLLTYSTNTSLPYIVV